MAEPFLHRLAVRYGEVDLQGVVFNAHYLAWCDDAMETWLRSLGLRVADHGWDFMLKKAIIEWHGAATVGDEVAIEVSVDRWGTTSFDVGFRGRLGEASLFTSTITYVGVRHGSRQPAPAPGPIRALLDPGDAAPP